MGSIDAALRAGYSAAPTAIAPRSPAAIKPELQLGIKPAKKRHHLQPGVGHYGVFSGSKWERQIYPIVRNFILANQ